MKIVKNGEEHIGNYCKRDPLQTVNTRYHYFRKMVYSLKLLNPPGFAHDERRKRWVISDAPPWLEEKGHGENACFSTEY
jgi:hypothetical protein